MGNKQHPASEAEDREQQLIAKAERLAEKKIDDGTASSQLIDHYLRLGTTKAALEKKKLEMEIKVLQAKEENLRYMTRLDSMFADAMSAFRRYNGEDDEED